MATVATDAVEVTAERATPEQAAGRGRRRIVSVASTLTAANVAGAAMGFITGPLLARALGASGRGDLAAVIVPVTFLPGIAGLGVSAYAYRELPRRSRPAGEVIGSLAVPILLLGLIVAACGFPLADILAGGRSTVRTFLTIGFLAAPLALLGSLLVSSLSALEQWRRVVATVLIPFTLYLIGITVADILGDLTVAAASAAWIAGSLLALVPGIPVLVRSRPRFRLSIARAGVSFGLRSWVGGLAQMANTRLDQLLMITVVAPRELGLYAVAVTIAGSSSLAAGGLAPPLMTRIAAGERRLMSQAVRRMIVATIAVNIVLAAVSPLLLIGLFGAQFRGAYPMVLILLCAQVPLVGASVLSGALQADGAPLIPTIGEGIALVLTVAGLALLLGPLGGVGAAIVSVAAYGASCSFQVSRARGRIEASFGEFLIPTRGDLVWLGARANELLRRVASRR
jgi:O-antigen/teichoic acid export membrane protein